LCWIVFLHQKTFTIIISSFLGPEWDSSDEEEENEQPVVATKDKNNKKNKSKSDKTTTTTTTTITTTKSNKKIEKEIEKDDDVKSHQQVLYIGHLPKEFLEKDLRNFLSQFGKVYNCRVARKIETGNSKGYAFVKFADPEVAEVVCDTLHGYFLGTQRLVCQLRQSYPGMFFDTNEVITKRRNKLKLQKNERNRALANTEKLKEITARLVSREQKKRKKLEALGIDYDYPGYDSNDAQKVVVKEKDADDDVTPTKRKDVVASEGSAKKKRRKDSVDSESSAKKSNSKRKESVDSTGSTEDKKKHQKKERNDSVESEGSAKKKKRKNSDASNHDDADHDVSKGEVGDERLTKSAKKASKKKKDKKRRQSAP
jgi:nucleolar protein 15